MVQVIERWLEEILSRVKPVQFSKALDECQKKGGLAKYKSDCIALVEIGEPIGPHLILEVLTSHCGFVPLFEMELISQKMVYALNLHLPVVVRLSTNEHPNTDDAVSGCGNLPSGNSLQTSDPEQDRAKVS